MIEYFINYFEEIAKDYKGEYIVTEEKVGGIGCSTLPLSKHYIKVPNGEQEISFYIEFGGTAFATINTIVENAYKSKTFKFKKRSPYILLLSKNKKCIRVESKIENVKLAIEKMLLETGLEDIARNTLFEPIIKFNRSGQSLNIEMMFSMAFEDKEKVIRPIIEFLKKLSNYLKM